jgi:hypothetical protein
MVHHFVSFSFLSFGGDHLMKCRAVNLWTILSSFVCNYVSTCVHTKVGCHPVATHTLFCCSETQHHVRLAVFCSRLVWFTNVVQQVVCDLPLSYQQHKSKVWWNCICAESSDANMHLHCGGIWLHVGLHVKWSLKLTSIDGNWNRWTVFRNILQSHI